jgi:uncharacterized surface protein with fasciclin (FAS1) repeats
MAFKYMILAASAVALAACGQPQPAPETTMAPAAAESAAATADATTIVSAAAADPRFTTLVSAVSAAGLAETLSGEGPFTVFAPTNEAFAAINDQVQALLANTDKAPLTGVLTYHVVPGRIMAADLAGVATTPATVQGGTLAVTAGPNGPQIGGANVVQADIVVGNGVIHVIDQVLLPPAQ